MTRSLTLPPLRRTARDAEAFARVEAATRAYCDAWCAAYADLGAEIPSGMRERSGPAYEETKRCIIEALMAADAVRAGHKRRSDNFWAALMLVPLIGLVISTIGAMLGFWP